MYIAVQVAIHAESDDDDDALDEVDEALMITVDSADLRCEPERYGCHAPVTDISPAVNQLAMNAADVAGSITCQPQHQQQQQHGRGHQRQHCHCGDDDDDDDVDQCRDVIVASSSNRDRDVDGDVSSDRERVVTSSSGPDDVDTDTETDDEVKVTSRVVGDGQCDDDDVTNDVRCVALSQLATESQVAMETETFLRQMMWAVSMKQLRRHDWDKLARQWHFTGEHIRAIRCQYTGLSVCLSICPSVCLAKFHIRTSIVVSNVGLEKVQNHHFIHLMSNNKPDVIKASIVFTFSNSKVTN